MIRIKGLFALQQSTNQRPQQQGSTAATNRDRPSLKLGTGNSAKKRKQLPLPMTANAATAIPRDDDSNDDHQGTAMDEVETTPATQQTPRLPLQDVTLFETKLDELRLYVQSRVMSSHQKEDCLPPPSHPLHTWLTQLDNSKLSTNQLQALNNVLIIPNQPRGRFRKNKKFDERLRELKAFRDIHGHCQVPCRPHRNEYKSLGEWTSNIRQGTLKTTPAQRAQLDAIGFHWEMLPARREREWHERYQRLVAYHAKYGTARVPFEWKGDKQLAEWCNTQRKFYKTGRMRPAREELLQKVGFDFRADSRRAPRKGEAGYAEKQKDAPS